MLFYDIEADGLLYNITRIHCLVIYDDQQDVIEEYGPESIEQGVQRLHGEDVCGHYILGYDHRVLKWFFPWYSPRSNTDTLILSRLRYHDLFGLDMMWRKKGMDIQPKLYGRHSLEAWGERMGFPKDDYAERMKAQGVDPWAEWNPAMQAYCVQDVRVTHRLYRYLEPDFEKIPDEAIKTEHEVGEIITRQWLRGVCFDDEQSDRLIADLQGQLQQLYDDLQEYFPPWYAPDAPTADKARLKPKRGRPDTKTKGHGYVAGAELTKVKRVVFNPGSRDHVADRLQRVYGWKPTQYGNDGKPTVDDDILRSLPYEPADKLADYFRLKKHLGQLSDGDKAYSRFVNSKGRIHGHVDTIGTRTYRMSHSEPNLGQVPTRDEVWGHRFRELFYAPEPYVMVGCDAEGLEMRTLAHFTHRFDGGQFARMCIEGDKSEGTDQHTQNQKAIGLNSRDSAKTWFYGFIYGAGDYKLGTIIYEDMTSAQRKKFGKLTAKKLTAMGKKSRERIENNVPGLAKFVNAAQKVHTERGYLKGLDGRRLYSASAKSAPNTINQSAGALIMKKALVFADSMGRESYGEYDWEFVLNVHDEYQAEAPKEISEELGEIFSSSIEEAGKFYGLRVPLAGESAVGARWSETH